MGAPPSTSSLNGDDQPARGHPVPMENPNPVVFAVESSSEEPFIYDANIPLTSDNIFSMRSKIFHDLNMPFRLDTKD